MVKCSFTMCEASRCHPLPLEIKGGERKTKGKRKEGQKVHEEERDDKIGL